MNARDIQALTFDVFGTVVDSRRSIIRAGEALAQARGALELAWLIAAGAAGEALRQAEGRADAAEGTREETARRRADDHEPRAVRPGRGADGARRRVARDVHPSRRPVVRHRRGDCV